MQHVGVDGCRAGWLAVTRNRSSELTWQVFKTVEDIVSNFSDAERILIDIPMGLPCSDSQVRLCDRLARQALGRLRRSSVFPVPCREALAADGIEAARRINRFHIGRSISAQTWGICPKIRDVDRFLLRRRTAERHCIREVHPEICFWGLAGRPMTHSKATVAGQEERSQVLRQYELDIHSLLNNVLSNTIRRHVKEDDVIDAAVAFVTAEALRGEIASLPDMPPRDMCGLPMEMVYLRI